ncbi:MAG TPA: D-glycerate dehydrogenase [Rhodocyclaceae bacterium]|nr:MAG: D-glycerate dehydrogenase [Rhodocyclales bacterium CG_4_9_14_3_um_filter_68_10]HCX33842.1 D-glycerate dehydrogenase [Rhodocyclaceae bacterium]
MTGRVLVTRRVFPEVTELLRCHFEVEDNPEDRILDAEGLAARLADKEGLFSMATDRIDAALIRRAPRLRAVANCAVGYNNIDVPACRARGIIVTNTPGVLDDTTADHAFALLLAAARRVAESDRWVREGRWKGWVFDDWLGADVHGARLGIVGMGRIGQALARRAAGFSMRVSYHNRNRLPEAVETACSARYAGQDELLRESDFVVLTVPYTPETHHLIGAKELAQMKPGAILVNIARGGVVDDRALIEALRSGRIAAAGLDVFEHEPKLDADFLRLPSAVLTPHIGSATRATRMKMAMLAAENLIAALSTGAPPNPV